MSKAVRNIIILVALAFAAFWILPKFVVPSLTNIFKPAPVLIDETPILVKQIRSIGELITAVASDEVVVQSVLPTRGSAFVNSVNKLSPIDILPSADKKIVLIGRGKVMAGTDFATIAENGLKINGDTAWITLPKATIIDAVMNPSDFETFEETGRWTSEEVNKVKVAARQQMIDRAIANNILKTANEKAMAVVEQFFYNAGYKVVEINKPK